MLRLIAGRAASSILVLAGVSMLIFAIARLIPGDPARIALGPTATAEQVATLRAERHLDQPITRQYWEYLKDVAAGDLGTSLYTNRGVARDIVEYLPATLELVLIAGLLMVAIGIPTGILSARFKGSLADQTMRFGSILCISTPAFVWAVLFQLFFAFWIALFPLEGRLPADAQFSAGPTGFMLIDLLIAGKFHLFLSAAHHLVLPALALAMAGIGQTARLTRANMITAYARPYTDMARAYGFKESRIARRYAFRPALMPTLTILGLDFAAMLGNAFLVERVYGWPGLSRYGVEVILRKDLDAIVGTVMIISAVFLITNLLVDLLIAWVNPRIRYGSEPTK